MNQREFTKTLTTFEQIVTKEYQLKQLSDAVADVNETDIRIGVNVTFYFSRKDNRYVAGIDASLLNGLLYNVRDRTLEALDEVSREKAKLKDELQELLEEA